MSIKKNNIVIPEINLPLSVTKTFGGFYFPYVIRNLECRLIYTNQAGAEVYNVKSPKEIIGLFDYEIKCPLMDAENGLAEFDLQYRKVIKTKMPYNTLEVRLKALQYSYIFRKMPCFNENKECVGMVGYNEKLCTYSLNNYIKLRVSGSLLLDKPDDFFSESQCEIMFYRLQGLTVKDVAARLNLTVNTVNNYMQTLYDKTEARNLDDFKEFCERRSYHRYLPQRFITSEAISFGNAMI